jgi:hypothetical protein
MTKAEFIRTCAACGYAPKKVAEEYAEGLEDLTDDDFIEVYRIAARQLDLKNRVADERFRGYYKHAKTTKRFVDEADNR